MSGKTQSLLFLVFKQKLTLISTLVLVLFSCDQGTLTKKKINKEGSASQEIQNKEIVPSPTTSVEIDSSNIDLMLTLGSDFYVKKEYERAFNQFMAVYKVDNKNLTAIISIGNLFYDTQQHTEAIKFYQEALEIDPNELSVRCDMATSYSRIGMLEKAIEINKKTLEMDFNHAQSHHNLAVFYKEQGKTEEAEKETKIYNQLMSGL